VDARDFCANAPKTRFALLRGHDELIVVADHITSHHITSHHIT
jgi:hypothetical protein